MTTLYRPVLIESAEQAEALPEGTIISYLLAPTVLISDEERVWVDGEDTVMTGADLYAARDVWTVLAPVEAEEEWTAMGSDNGDPWIAHIGHDGIDGSREEAEAYTRRFGGFVARRALTPWEEA